ncbi:DUF805 domain-containing protein [Vogesella indigofera]|uniref:DUF805 domain-containing protein n=1 Tax=Vogesella indigofera TaxID=45465 RepID=UPI00234E6E26|nr:DUF805 domain-containing protein [Vogesella indigofera]MDC7698343.1 DUF805 domain-containing protein [Vogesella indigofera]
MFCQKCGQNNQDLAKFCSRCGTSLGSVATPSDMRFSAGPTPDQMTFGKAISMCLSKYADFKGRATRSEYWWFILFTFLVSLVALIIDPTEVLSNVLSLVFFLPSLAAATRRLHDGNRSGWWQLLAITVIGLIPLLIWMCSKGDPHRNDYGQPV